MSNISNALLSYALPWALARLNDRNTWVTWIVAAAAHFGGVINPEFNTLLVNVATGIVVIIGYAYQGKPIFTGKGVK
jgi:hypothetical protein